MHLNQYTEQLADFALQICSGDQGPFPCLFQDAKGKSIPAAVWTTSHSTNSDRFSALFLLTQDLCLRAQHSGSSG